MGFANWSAPAHLRSGYHNVQKVLMGTMCSDMPQSICLIVLPVHSNVKGQVWEATSILMKEVKRFSLNTDLGFSILIDERKDKRDERPLIYQGRIAFALGGQETSVQSMILPTVTKMFQGARPRQPQSSTLPTSCL